MGVVDGDGRELVEVGAVVRDAAGAGRGGLRRREEHVPPGDGGLRLLRRLEPDLLVGVAAARRAWRPRRSAARVRIVSWRMRNLSFRAAGSAAASRARRARQARCTRAAALASSESRSTSMSSATATATAKTSRSFGMSSGRDDPPRASSSARALRSSVASLSRWSS